MIRPPPLPTLFPYTTLFRSTAIDGSPRPASDAAVSYPRPPRTCIASSAMRQVVSVAHILHIAVSIRRSPALRSSSDDVRNVIASMAKTFPAISAILPAIAACLPMGTPHWMRSPAYHLRRRARHHYEHAGFHTVSAPKLFAI